MRHSPPTRMVWTVRKISSFPFFYLVLLVWTTLAAGLIPSGRPADPPPSPALSRGVELFHQHDFDHATAAFRQELDKDSNNVEALIFMGRIAFERNQLDEAVRQFELATIAAPHHSPAFHWLGRACGIQARELGPPMGIGPARRTKKALENAVRWDPDNVEARLDLATYLREAPFIVGGSRKSALAQVEEIHRRDPYMGALARGDVAMDDKRFDEARRQFERAADLAPGRTEAHYRLGVLHQKTRQFDQAFSAFERVLKIAPDEKTALFQIGKTADLSGQRMERGAAALLAYLQCEPFFIMPKRSWAYRRLGNIYLQQGLTNDARSQYVAALKAAPEDKEASAALKHLDGLTRRP